jgi:hypothetical protein
VMAIGIAFTVREYIRVRDRELEKAYGREEKLTTANEATTGALRELTGQVVATTDLIEKMVDGNAGLRDAILANKARIDDLATELRDEAKRMRPPG